MARPTMTTPVETTVTVLRALIGWADSYGNELGSIFGADHDIDQRAGQLAEQLEQHERDYVREQREDVAVTNRRARIVELTQRLVRSGTALAMIVFDDARNLDDVLTDFAAAPPSQIRSPRAARKALVRLKAAIDIHHEPMADTLANFDDFRQQVRDALDELDELAGFDATETAETQTARRSRQQTRREAVTLIRNMQLAGEALEFMQPDALADLHAIFDTHMPRHRPSVPEEDILEDAGDQPPDTDADTDTPTPSDDADADADADTDTDTPAPADDADSDVDAPAPGEA